MKNLFVIITTVLFFNIITINTIGNKEDNTPFLSSPHQDLNLPILSKNHDTAITYLSEKWQLSDLQPIMYSSLFNNYIARAYSYKHQQDVVLKISESHDECKALQCLQSDGIVKLLDYDHEYYALLLQYIPSQGCLTNFLQTEHDDWIIDAFIHLFKKIHASPKIVTTNDFKTVQDHFSIVHTYKFIKISENLLEKAAQIHDQLLKSKDPQYVLHFDLHFQNMLKFEDDFIAIDPLAAVGPLECEVASFLASPTDFLLSQDNPHDVLQNRLNRLSNILHLNKKLLKDCAFMRVIFLACLCEMKNKNDDWIDQFIQVAEIIDKLNTD